MGILIQDVRHSARLLRKSPGFTIVAVLTLAMAISANAIVFAILNALILRPLNVPRPESLYLIEHGRDKSTGLSYPDFLDVRGRNRSFDGVAVSNTSEVGLDSGGGASHAWANDVSGNYFDVLRIQPYLGRFFHASDEHGPNSAPYVVLTYAYWQNHFQGNRGVVGRAVRMNNRPFTIIGVAPPGFHGAVLFFSLDFFVPFVSQQPQDLNARGTVSTDMVIGRLKPGVTPQQAISDLNAVGSYLEKTYPKTEGNMRFVLAQPSLWGDAAGPAVRAFLTALMLLAALILLAACANLGGLFAARLTDRTREVALRLALGATRKRVVRALFTEALLVSLLGGVAGMWGSVAVSGALSAWQPLPKYPIQIALNPDARVYGMALLLTLTSGLLFGAIPVRQILRTDPYEIVKSGSRTIGARGVGIRDLLLGAQIAICALLVTCSIVAVRGVMRSLQSNFGFEPQNAMLMDTDLNMAGYRDDEIPVMRKRMIEAMEKIPGVGSVGMIDQPPLSPSTNSSVVFRDETTDLRPANAAARTIVFLISPGYFRVARTTLLSGRAFTWHDDKNAPRVAVINQEFARRVLGSVKNAMGSYCKLPDGTRIQIVGMVENGKYEDIAEAPQPAVFLPMLQSRSGATTLLVRSNRDLRQLAAAMRSTMRDLDPELPCYVQTWSEALHIAMFGPRMATLSLGILGVMGAMLAVTGIFGMAAYSVSKRLKELGIRMALGAQNKEVLQAALGRAFRLLTIGSAAGLVLGIAAARVLSAIVDQATPRDPLVLAGVVMAMGLLGLVATWIPAQRALALDPAALLREE